MRPSLSGLILLGTLVVTFWGATGLNGWLAKTPLQVTHSRFYLVARGATLTSIANDLVAAEIIGESWKLRLLAKLDGHTDRVLAGKYQLIPGMELGSLLSAFNRGETLKQQLTIVEGVTFSQLLISINDAPGLTHTLQGQTPAQIMDRLGLSGEMAEGRFFPDTYRYHEGYTDLALLAHLYQNMQNQLQNEWATRSSQLEINTPYEALILASIIEKESGLDSERRRISGVFHRRLKINMKLQADSTIIYGLGTEFDGDLRRRDMRRDTPYNSYIHKGLPPTPIAMPGLASIKAALNPDTSDDTLYFVATGKGGHYFSTTLQEHNRAVARYLSSLR